MAKNEKKSDIISWIDKSEDDELIAVVHESILQYKTTEDFWEGLSQDQKSKIETGLGDIKDGNFISHQDVIAKHET